MPPTWVETRIRLGLSELMDARATAELPAGARGIVFQLCESLGVLPRRPIEEQLAQLGEDDRKALARLGVQGRRLFALFPEHAEAGADPAPRRPLDDRAQSRDDSAAARRGPHVDGSAARRGARFLRHHRLPAAGRPRNPRRHGRAPGRDGTPGRAREPRSGAAHAARKRAPGKEARAGDFERCSGGSPRSPRPTRSANGRSWRRRSARANLHRRLRAVRRDTGAGRGGGRRCRRACRRRSRADRSPGRGCTARRDREA